MGKKISGVGLFAVSSAMLCAILVLSDGARYGENSFRSPREMHAARLSHVLYAQQAATVQLSAEDTQVLYEDKCALCHGLDKTGKPPTFPSLVGVTSRYSDEDVAKLIRNGKGHMPAFPGLTPVEVHALVNYLKPVTPPPAADPKAPASIAELLRPASFSE